MAFTGLFMGGTIILAPKDNRLEQLIIGAITALAMRFWVLTVTYLMMHPKENKVHEMIHNKIKANRAIRTNNAKFYAGILVIAISISKNNECCDLFVYSIWSGGGVQSVIEIYDKNGGKLGMGILILNNNGLYTD
jgi:hypothetical protein